MQKDFNLIDEAKKERDEFEKGSKVITYQGGLIERSETFFFLLTLIFLIPLRFILLWVFAILVFVTALLRLSNAHKTFHSAAN